MTLFYQTNSWSSQPQLTQETLNLWKHVADKSNWRIVQLPNGFFQTEYKDPNCECDASLSELKRIGRQIDKHLL